MSALESDVLVPALPTDVLTIVLEELLDFHMSEYGYRRFHPSGNVDGSFLDLRLLSRQMSDLIVPVSFRYISLGRGILECFKTYLQAEYQLVVEHSWYSNTPAIIRAQKQVAYFVRTYTQHVWIDDEELEWSWVPDMLTHMGNLKHLTWSYWGNWSHGLDIEPSIQKEVLANSAFRASLPNLRISLEDFHSEDAALFYPLKFVNLESCTGRYRYPVVSINTSYAIQIKNILLASPKMEVFDLAFQKSRTRTVNWGIKAGEKLPAFKELLLSGFDWNFSPIEAIEFWDWSRITCLRMTEVPIIPFLKTVAPEHLSGLRTFETDCYGAEHSVEEASKLLCAFVASVVTFEELAMKCGFEGHSNRFFPAIIKHGPNLRSLVLRDLHPPQDGPKPHAVLSIQKLTALHSACSKLTSLEIDVHLNPRILEKTGHILTTTIASFRNLRRLDLYTMMSYPMPVHSFWEPHNTIAAMLRPWVEELVSLKKGAAFDSLWIYVDVKGAPDERVLHLRCRCLNLCDPLSFVDISVGDDRPYGIA